MNAKQTVQRGEDTVSRAAPAHAMSLGDNNELFNEKIHRTAHSAYAPSAILPYHNWDGHIVPMERCARMLCDRMAKYGLAMDRKALFLAIRFHDAMLNIDERAFGMHTKEELAARYAAGVIQSNGGSKRLAQKVERIIKATHADAIPETIEECLIRAADVHNLAAPYEIFKENTLNLYEEAQRTTGSGIEFDCFVRGSLRFLGKYLAVSICLTPDAMDREGRSLWHSKALVNLLRLYVESSFRGCSIQAQLAPLDPAEVPHLQLTEGALVIGVCDPKQSRACLDALERKRAECSGEAVMLVVPGSPSRAPIPTGSCDVIRFMIDGDEAVVSEAIRIASEHSTIVSLMGNSTSPEAVLSAHQKLRGAGFHSVEAASGRITYRR